MQEGEYTTNKLVGIVHLTESYLSTESEGSGVLSCWRMFLTHHYALVRGTSFRAYIRRDRHRHAALGCFYAWRVFS